MIAPAPHLDSTATLTIPVAVVENGLTLGLRQAWIEAQDDGVDAYLASGAGLGSPYLILTVERPGKSTIREAVDVRDFLPDWIDAAIARTDNPTT